MYELKYGSAGPLFFDIEEATDPDNPTVFTPVNVSLYTKVAVVVAANRGEGPATEFSSSVGADGVTLHGSIVNRIVWTVPASAYGTVLRRTATAPYLCYVRLYTSATRWFAVPESAGAELHIRPAGT